MKKLDWCYLIGPERMIRLFEEVMPALNDTGKWYSIIYWVASKSDYLRTDGKVLYNTKDCMMLKTCSFFYTQDVEEKETYNNFDLLVRTVRREETLGGFSRFFTCIDGKVVEITNDVEGEEPKLINVHGELGLPYNTLV